MIGAVTVFDRFKAASPRQQLWLAIGGICVLAALLFLLWFGFIRTTYQALFTDLKTNEASTIVAELDKKKIPYRLANGGAIILVPSEMADSARLDVMGGDLPLKGTVGFEIFNKTDMGLTDFAQKINYQRALQGELERTIMTLDGVDTARVHLSMGEDRLFREDQSPPKASITIRMARGAVLSESVAEGVKRLAAAAVPKMSPSDVVLLDEKGQAVSIFDAAVAADKPASPFPAEKRAVEEFYESRILRMLSEAGFSRDISVSVSAEIPTADGFSDWSQAARDFPLRVTFSSAIALAPADQQKLRALVGKATGVALMGNDTVLFDTAPIVMGAATAKPWTDGAAKQPSSATPMSAAGEDDGPIAFGWLRVAIPVLVVFLAGFLLIWKLRGPRRLSAERQAEFVERIRAALEERESRAISQS